VRHKIKLSKAAAQMVVAEWITRDILLRVEPNEYNDPEPEVTMTLGELRPESRRLRTAVLCVAFLAFVLVPFAMLCLGGDWAAVPSLQAPADSGHADIRGEIEAAFGEAAPVKAGATGGAATNLRAQWETEYRRATAKINKDRKLAGTWECDGCRFRPVLDGPGQLDHHHLVSVSRIATEQLPVELIWDPRNLVLACRRDGPDGHECGCHWAICHRVAGKSNWSTANKNSKNDLAARQKLHP